MSHKIHYAAPARFVWSTRLNPALAASDATAVVIDRRCPALAVRNHADQPSNARVFYIHGLTYQVEQYMCERMSVDETAAAKPDRTVFKNTNAVSLSLRSKLITK